MGTYMQTASKVNLLLGLFAQNLHVRIGYMILQSLETDMTEVTGLIRYSSIHWYLDTQH